MHTIYVVVNYLQEKWAFHFEMADINKDGVVNQTDGDISQANFVSSHNLTEEQVRRHKGGGGLQTEGFIRDIGGIELFR